jgi:uncharacterized membrane protein
MPFTDAQKESIAHAIADAETMTSAEIRIYVERKSDAPTALDRARQMFYELGMEKTTNRNAVLLYIALETKLFALYGDQQAHHELPNSFWWQAALELQNDLSKMPVADSLCASIRRVGKALSVPYPDDNGPNELPNELILGNDL